MKFAWIEDGRIRDIAPGNPMDWYHPDVAKFYDTQVPDTAEKDDFWDGTNATKPQPPAEVPAPVERKWSIDTIRSKLTLAERVKWDNDKSDAIKTAKIELATPQLVAHTTEVLQLLVDAGDISAATMQAVLA